MLDYTHRSYVQYLRAIKNNSIYFVRFDEYFNAKDLDSFCLIRHDVDRKPKRALKMAVLENKLGIKATYFFRTKSFTFKPNIIKEIFDLGHEIGYHYESLSDTNGNVANAIADFENNLNKLRKIAPVKTCAMHGKPLSKYDNRDIWKIKENHEYLKIKLDIIGEVYLDINYSEIAYINDTGRNWTSGVSNLRDHIVSDIICDFNNKNELIEFLKDSRNKKICFQIHPERWTTSLVGYIQQILFDNVINLLKKIIYIMFFSKFV